MAEALGETEASPLGDVEARRIGGHRMMDYVAATTAPAEGVATEQFSLPTGDGAALDATWYRRSAGERPGSAVLYIHGGGMIFGLEHIGAMCDLTVREYVAASGVPMLVVDYRVAPEFPHPFPSKTAMRHSSGWPNRGRCLVSIRPGWPSWATAPAVGWRQECA